MGAADRRRLRDLRARAGDEPLVPASHPLHLSDYFVSLAGKIMCYAIVALAMDLIWGYTGILSLGHGLSSRSAAMRWGCT
jgi:ABC-type branched-subunit amino acid transport system permease subunit